MKTVYVMCEGDSEVTFVKEILSEYLQGQILFYPITFTTSFNRKKGEIYRGGVPVYDSVKKHISGAIKSGNCNYLTTMIDYYGLSGKGFPGVSDNRAVYNDIYSEIAFLENEFNKDIENLIKENNLNVNFFSYYQLHEFETLLFSDLDKLKLIEPEWSEKEINLLKESIRNFNNIEFINNSPNTAPSKRLNKAFSNVKYNKIIHSKLIIEAISIDNIRAKCRHFDEWLVKIENLVAE